MFFNDLFFRQNSSNEVRGALMLKKSKPTQPGILIKIPQCTYEAGNSSSMYCLWGICQVVGHVSEDPHS